MKKWNDKLEEIFSYIDLIKNDYIDVFFRGQSNAEWPLLPGLARITERSEFFENRAYYDFVSYGGHLIPPYKSNWDVLFLMQHHGIPTRLLDWSENFSVALYFALKDAKPDKPAALYILNPFKLNFESSKKDIIDYLDVSYPKGYYNYFVDDGFKEFGKFPASIVAIGANPPNIRIVAQKSVFTIHNDLEKSLSELFPNTVTQIKIEPELFEDAKRFLYLTGINEFSLFPDLDGLSRYIKNKELEK